MQGYLYDPHTHTAETSKCGHLLAADVVERYVKHGFSGLVVTDHLHPEYLSRIDTEHDWQKAMDHYLSGYKASKKRGDELGFDVILGAELRFPQNDNDYLVYGIDEDWLRSNPYMCCTSAREFYEKFHNEVLIIHAHPYRDGNTTVFEGDVRIAGGRTIRFSRLHLKRELSWRIVGKKALAARHAGFGVDRPLCGLVLNDRSDRSLCGVFLDLLMELRVLLGLLR